MQSIPRRLVRALLESSTPNSPRCHASRPSVRLTALNCSIDHHTPKSTTASTPPPPLLRYRCLVSPVSPSSRGPSRPSFQRPPGPIRARSITPERNCRYPIQTPPVSVRQQRLRATSLALWRSAPILSSVTGARAGGIAGGRAGKHRTFAQAQERASSSSSSGPRGGSGKGKRAGGEVQRLTDKRKGCGTIGRTRAELTCTDAARLPPLAPLAPLRSVKPSKPSPRAGQPRSPVQTSGHESALSAPHSLLFSSHLSDLEPQQRQAVAPPPPPPPPPAEELLLLLRWRAP
ncbi:hypothetical protein Mp_1g06850 [Marchantia polymorpha subsp. ruderalis]|uniref:Uncharacterized protein n=2 Tax=Marchantia polymorpha TaxID=3197 RepID=A0AAF6AMC5_MARPO|nr:hypothetical protein MARPO_0043s0077 [Marchantia polymorpha]BBM97595.1 hypothetical protein Mp_1g06850 [Marchantia polymorpha subsp. ruderalis]|eukprot:PTQ39836.1 hypothetical protein MARPO_0043s0077 [Marchantia polymorpha]